MLSTACELLARRLLMMQDPARQGVVYELHDLVPWLRAPSEPPPDADPDWWDPERLPPWMKEEGD